VKSCDAIALPDTGGWNRLSGVPPEAPSETPNEATEASEKVTIETDGRRMVILPRFIAAAPATDVSGSPATA
jgi:hypothetical protein